jgi:uncharacterized protein YndB with AHSA1/START domain
MSVVSVDKDYGDLSITVVAEFEAPQEKVWELFTNPRLLERWWGPPTHPATFTDHDLSPGGRVLYYMTSPEGEKYHGLWEVEAVEGPVGFTAMDYFADAEGNALKDLPSSKMAIRLESEAGITRMVIKSTYKSSEELDKVVEMGALEGIRQAVGQIDAILAA